MVKKIFVFIAIHVVIGSLPLTAAEEKQVDEKIKPLPGTKELSKATFLVKMEDLPTSSQIWNAITEARLFTDNYFINQIGVTCDLNKKLLVEKKVEDQHLNTLILWISNFKAIKDTHIVFKRWVLMHMVKDLKTQDKLSEFIFKICT